MAAIMTKGCRSSGSIRRNLHLRMNIANVQAAVQKYGIQYPVVLDSDYGTWDAYGNLYWPHEYLIDMAGYIVHDQIGEGNYGETESGDPETDRASAIRSSAFSPRPRRRPPFSCPRASSPAV